MLAIKNPARLLSLGLVATSFIFAGCTPSGPKALLEGDAALRQGKFQLAVEKLKGATEAMPNEPRAWNALGVAYHKAGYREPAAYAYRQALARDHSNRVSVAHFNLGCLLLEGGDAAAAVSELRGYTMVTNSAQGWVKLGQAQMRLRQFDAAERSFANAMRLQRDEPEAYNNLGVLYARWNRPRDAEKYLSGALQLDPKYAPALLNSAIVANQAGTRQLALQRFRQYLALKPPPADWQEVQHVASQIEADLAPRNSVLTPTTAGAPTSSLVSVQNPVPAARTSLPPAIASTATNGNRPRSNETPLVVTRTNTPAAPSIAASAPITNTSPRLASVPPPAATNTPGRVATAAPQMTNTSPKPVMPEKVSVASVTNTPVRPTNPPVTLVSVEPPAPVTVATSSVAPIARANPTTPVPTGPASPPPAETNVAVATRPLGSGAVEDRGGFFSRMNPFRRSVDRNVPLDTGRVMVARPDAGAASSVRNSQSYPRYPYSNPTPAKPGRRSDAERALQQAGKSQKAGRTNDALLNYRLALEADPTYADAQYSYALLTQQSGDVIGSLPVWETVLALEPDSINTRYNFALALKQANYPVDAAAELQRIIDAKPGEARAHLTLANLYAQQLGDNARARDHYRKLLELEPRNPQAPTIRYWLAANP